MVRAMLREIEQPGTGKSQTRRTNGVPVIERTPVETWHIHVPAGGVFAPTVESAARLAAEFLPIQRGDRLWCREEHFLFGRWEIIPNVRTTRGDRKWRFVPDGEDVRFDAPAEYRRDRCGGSSAWHKRLGRFMFRKHSRLTLYVTDVRVERLHDISGEDARAEGVPSDEDYVGSFDREYCHHCGGSGMHGALGAGYGVTEVECAQCETPKLRYRNLWNHINGPGAWDANPWVAAYTFVPVLGNITTLPAVLADLPPHVEGSQP